MDESQDVSEKNGIRVLNSLHLKIIACFFMLCDHAWATVVAGNDWLTLIGRIAFPIFAFQVVEGFFLTHSFWKYFRRMLIFALISEIPFNLMVGGSPIYPMHQNVMFTFCLSLLCMYFLEKARKKGRAVLVLTAIAVFIVGFLAGFVTFVDYFGYGIWIVLLFYMTRGMKFGWIPQLAGMVYINCFMIGGLVYNIPIFGTVLEFPEQGTAVLALIPIWLYNGKNGVTNKAGKYFFYIFYPAHMLVLFLLSQIIHY